MDYGTTLVYGGAGAQGSTIARALCAKGRSVRVLTRSPEKAANIRKEGVEAVCADLSDAQAVSTASQGCENVVFTLPLVFDADLALEWTANVVVAAQSTGVKRFVFNASGPVPEEETGVVALDIKRRVSRLLVESGLPVITIQPTLYMGNLAAPWSAPAIVRDGVVAYPLPGDLKVSWISWETLAEFAAAALEHPGLAGRSFRIAGPEALTGAEVARTFAQHLRRPVTYFPVPLDDFRRNLAPVLGEAAADAITHLYAWFAGEGAHTLTPDIAPALEVLNVVPQRISEWVATVNWMALAAA